MRTSSPHCAEVFGQLPSLLVRALDTDEVASVVVDLVAAGWRTGQLRHRVGGEPSQGSVDRDAAHLLHVLRELRGQPCPDAVHAREVELREQARRWEQESAPPPASEQVRAAHVARIRAQLKGVPRRRREREPRTRAGCSLCAGEGTYFVTREVHLCKRCVDVLATGRARISATG
jgi:hypothetical protein